MSVSASIQRDPSGPSAVASLLAPLVGEAAAIPDEDRDAARSKPGRVVAILQADADRTRPIARQTALGGLAPWQARRAALHIDAHLERRLALSELAAVAGLSASYFSRAFKVSFGAAPHAYVLRRRVERAQAQMLMTSDPLSRIAVDCGFADQAHLSRVFRRLVGRTPHDWRRIHTSGAAPTTARAA